MIRRPGAVPIAALFLVPTPAAGPALEVAACKVAGAAPRIPAPLIRVPTGTVIRANLLNALADSRDYMRRPAAG
jgi:hypothetical protein